MMNQIVYVVYDRENDYVVGTYNELKDAEVKAYAYQEVDELDDDVVSITPVLVDSAVGMEACYTEEDAVNATEQLMRYAMRRELDEEEEEEDYDDDDDSDYDGDDDEYDNDDDDEKVDLIIDFTRRLVNSGYTIDEVIEIVNVLFPEEDEE